MLEPFDIAVIDYANNRGIDSAMVYRWCEAYLGNYRETYSQAQLLAALDRVKEGRIIQRKA